MTRRRKILIFAVLGLALAVVGARMAVNGYVVRKIVAALHDSYDVDVRIDDLAIASFSGRAKASGVHVEDGGETVLEADSVEISATFGDLIGGRYDFHKLTIARPTLHVVAEPGGTTNLSRILARRKPSEGPADFVLFRDGRIEDGRVVLDDAVTDPADAARFEFERIVATASGVQVSGEPKSQDFGDFRVDALLVQKGGPARISVVGWTQPVHEKPTFAAHAAVTGLDLAQMPQYVGKTTRLALGGDVMHFVASMRAKDGVIADGAVAGDVPAMKRTIPLKFGGTTSDPVFDEDSKLTAIFNLPFAHLGHVGDVALTTTWGFAKGGVGVAGDVGGGVLGAGEAVFGGAKDSFGAMTRLDPLGAITSAGGGVYGGLKSIGEGLLGGVKRIFGGGDSAAADEETRRKLATEYRDLHRARRRAMLEAALASAADAPARRKRIEKELEAPPPLDADADAR